MTEATRARELAIACEAKKHSLRQAQDGDVIVAFRLHPQEVPDGLLLARPGQRYQMALVALNDDDTPKPPEKQPHKAWADVKPTQRASILATKPAFQEWTDTANEEMAREWIRQYCGVESLAKLTADKWRPVERDYKAWMNEPRATG